MVRGQLGEASCEARQLAIHCAWLRNDSAVGDPHCTRSSKIHVDDKLYEYLHYCFFTDMIKI